MLNIRHKITFLQMNLKFKAKQLPFHRKESLYYILQYDNNKSLYMDLFNFSSNDRVNVLNDMDIEYQTDYCTMYDRFINMIKNSTPVEHTVKFSLYAQKIGKKWYIINTF